MVLSRATLLYLRKNWAIVDGKEQPRLIARGYGETEWFLLWYPKVLTQVSDFKLWSRNLIKPVLVYNNGIKHRSIDCNAGHEFKFSSLVYFDLANFWIWVILNSENRSAENKLRRVLTRNLANFREQSSRIIAGSDVSFDYLSIGQAGLSKPQITRISITLARTSP